jgi:hypothetical protein
MTNAIKALLQITSVSLQPVPSLVDFICRLQIYKTKTLLNSTIMITLCAICILN